MKKSLTVKAVKRWWYFEQYCYDVFDSNNISNEIHGLNLKTGEQTGDIDKMYVEEIKLLEAKGKARHVDVPESRSSSPESETFYDWQQTRYELMDVSDDQLALLWRFASKRYKGLVANFNQDRDFYVRKLYNHIQKKKISIHELYERASKVWAASK